MKVIKKLEPVYGDSLVLGELFIDMNYNLCKVVDKSNSGFDYEEKKSGMLLAGSNGLIYNRLVG